MEPTLHLVCIWGQLDPMTSRAGSLKGKVYIFLLIITSPVHMEILNS